MVDREIVRQLDLTLLAPVTSTQSKVTMDFVSTLVHLVVRIWVYVPQQQTAMHAIAPLGFYCIPLNSFASTP